MCRLWVSYVLFLCYLIFCRKLGKMTKNVILISFHSTQLFTNFSLFCRRYSWYWLKNRDDRKDNSTVVFSVNIPPYFMSKYLLQIIDRGCSPFKNYEICFSAVFRLYGLNDILFGKGIFAGRCGFILLLSVYF